MNIDKLLIEYAKLHLQLTVANEQIGHLNAQLLARDTTINALSKKLEEVGPEPTNRKVIEMPAVPPSEDAGTVVEESVAVDEAPAQS